MTVREVKEQGLNWIKFRRTLYGETEEHWQLLCQMVNSVHLSSDPDTVTWKLDNKGHFSVRSLYLQLKAGCMVGYRFLWQLKLPLKIKIFLWLMLKNSILTKDNLLRRGWAGCEQCHFCLAKETVDHLFFRCTAARFIWQVVICALGITRAPANTSDMFDAWFYSFAAGQRKLMFWCSCGGLDNLEDSQ